MNNDSSIIILRGLEGNDPTQYTQLQTLLLPHLVTLKAAWWCVFAGVLAFMALRYVVIPLFLKK